MGDSNFKIHYILPEFMWFGRNEILITFFENNKYLFKDYVDIYTFYGTFPNAIWNGGGHQFYPRNYTKKEMIAIRKYYNKRNIPVTFTFTNSLITEEFLYDEYCNQILNVFHNGMNEILVVSPTLEKYIRENYPKYKINRSIINTEKVPFLLGNYNLSVLSKFRNKDFEFINKLDPQERSRTELLCDEICVNDCPYAYKHYREHAYIQLYKDIPLNAEKNYATCRFSTNKYDFFQSRKSNSKYWISYEDMLNTYVPLGFQYFKLSGRGTFKQRSLIKLVDYLIKDEYQQDVLVFLAERMMAEYPKEIFYILESLPDYSNIIKNNGIHYEN